MHMAPHKQKTPRPKFGESDVVPLSAGVFTKWLASFEGSLAGATENVVPCGDCIACCSSSYFIHIKPTDIRALKAIPKELRFAAPGMPEGHSLLGHDRKGACALLKEGRCTIYQARPGTCKAYDCRVFAAAGIPAGGREKQEVNLRVQQWAFEYTTPLDRAMHDAIRTAAKFITTRADAFPDGRAPDNPSQIAILAIQCRNLFLDSSAANLPATEIAHRIVANARQAQLLGRTN